MPGDSRLKPSTQRAFGSREKRAWNKKAPATSAPSAAELESRPDPLDLPGTSTDDTVGPSSTSETLRVDAAYYSTAEQAQRVERSAQTKTVLSGKSATQRKFDLLGPQDEGYTDWLATHECQRNIECNSGRMEVEAALTMFQRSWAKHGLRYTTVLSDGDSRTFHALSEAEVYGFIQIDKKDCINHVHKRMGAALRNLVDKKKAQGESLGGRGKLTQEKIKKIANYYGYALRSNINDVPAMKRAVEATLLHMTSTDDAPKHSKCPEGASSWCKYNRALANGEIFARLSDESLLARCCEGKTQNASESLHSVIWTQTSKNGNASLESVKRAAAEAVAIYNQGRRATNEPKNRQFLAPGSRVAPLGSKACFNAPHGHPVAVSRTLPILFSSARRADRRDLISFHGLLLSSERRSWGQLQKLCDRFRQIPLVAPHFGEKAKQVGALLNCFSSTAWRQQLGLPKPGCGTPPTAPRKPVARKAVLSFAVFSQFSQQKQPFPDIDAVAADGAAAVTSLGQLWEAADNASLVPSGLDYLDFALADQDLVAMEELTTDELAASISEKGTAADSSSSDGEGAVPTEVTLEKFTNADSEMELCDELTDDEIVRQALEDDDSGSDNEEPVTALPKLTQALLTLSAV
ncbi:hypothetical protein HPB52_023507 [Rhipicephalus sanguineus]|uniref:Mutator-like transposase domain-containing protein n=1 Tax=Rhipicephalus sanguineus TaxID=34632 RepID=A0A9D4TC57_RHISA|nr:hypothetical protein HPB52_023507 [Rhipicephalus sanguineus]